MTTRKKTTKTTRSKARKRKTTKATRREVVFVPVERPRMGTARVSDEEFARQTGMVRRPLRQVLPDGTIIETQGWVEPEEEAADLPASAPLVVPLVS